MFCPLLLPRRDRYGAVLVCEDGDPSWRTLHPLRRMKSPSCRYRATRSAGGAPRDRGVPRRADDGPLDLTSLPLIHLSVASHDSGVNECFQAIFAHPEPDSVTEH